MKSVLSGVLLFIVALFAWVVLRALTGGAPQEREATTAELLAALPPLPPVADEENGWLLSRSMPDAIIRPVMKGRRPLILPGEEGPAQLPGVDESFIRQYKADNPEIMATTRRILELSGWQHVRDDKPVKIPVDWDRRLDLPLKVILAEAVLPGLSGDHGVSWPDILAIMRLGRRISEGGGPIMESLGGFGFIRQAARATGLVGQFMQDSGMARRIAGELEAFEDCQTAFRRGLEGELYDTLRMNEVFAAGGEPVKKAFVELGVSMNGVRYETARYLVLSQREKEDFFGEKYTKAESEIPEFPAAKLNAQWLKDPPVELLEQLKEIERTDWNLRSREAAEVFHHNRALKVTTWADFKGQRFDFREAATTADLLLLNFFPVIANLRLTRTSLILRAWMLDHDGQLPESLDALVPDYLPALPVDPYDGQPLRYDKEKLWSVGHDLKDGGEDSRDDIVQPL